MPHRGVRPGATRSRWMLQALPIWRGGGVDQPLLLDVARRVSNGDWVHVFPEGRVVQSGRLATDEISTRSEEEVARIGRLKWGVGKLIAHAAVPPTVLPWHHRGMAAVLPQHAEWRDDGRGGRRRKRHTTYRNPFADWRDDGRGGRRFDQSVKSWVPRAGNRVTVEFGPSVEYRDLILAHEQARAPGRRRGSVLPPAQRAGFTENDSDLCKKRACTRRSKTESFGSISLEHRCLSRNYRNLMQPEIIFIF